MTTLTTQLDTRGRATVPQEVRDGLHVGPGDDLVWVTQADGSALVSTRTALVRAARGSARGRGTLDEFLTERRTELASENAKYGISDEAGTGA